MSPIRFASLVNADVGLRIPIMDDKPLCPVKGNASHAEIEVNDLTRLTLRFRITCQWTEVEFPFFGEIVPFHILCDLSGKDIISSQRARC